MITDSEMDILIEGGYKFGGRISFGFDGFLTLPGEYIPPPPLPPPLPSSGTISMPLSFKAAELMVRDIGGIGLDFSYFIGESSYLCYGDDFNEYFGTTMLESTYTPPPIINLAAPFSFIEYRGIHRINGTGVKLTYVPDEAIFGLEYFLYQDHNFKISESYGVNGGTTIILNSSIDYLDTGWYGTDLRLFLNFENIKIEAFGGGSIDSGSGTGYFRFGSLFFASAGPFDFLLEAGIPWLDPLAIGGLEMWFILFETRIAAGPITITPTVFAHPATYMHNYTATETNVIDFSLDIAVNNPRKDFISFGLETTWSTSYLLFSSTPGWVLYGSPYITLATPGVSWEIKARSTVWDSTMASFDFGNYLTSIQGVVSIRAVF